MVFYKWLVGIITLQVVLHLIRQGNQNHVVLYNWVGTIITTTIASQHWVCRNHEELHLSYTSRLPG